MRVRDVVGKRIVGVRQERWQSNSGWIWTVRSFQLEDGTSVVFHVVEGEDQHGIEVSTHKQRDKITEREWDRLNDLHGLAILKGQRAR